MPGSRKLGRPTDHRKAMLRGMVTFLLENGKIETTVTRAKEVRAMAEKMITLGKKNTLASKRQVLSYVTKEDVVKKLFDEIAPKYEDRNGGYTRIVKTGPRRGDAAEMCIIELVYAQVIMTVIGVCTPVHTPFFIVVAFIIKMTKVCRQFAPGSRLIECTHNGKRFDQQKGNVRCSVKRKLRPCPY